LTTLPEPIREIAVPDAPQLYNLQDDPLEQNNLAESHPEKAQQLLSRLETWFEEVESERQQLDDARI